MKQYRDLAMCGCRCDLCRAYAPNVEKSDEREHLAKIWNKYYGLDSAVMGICGGCRAAPSDEECPVRKCVLKKNINHCGDCNDFPCDNFYCRCGSFTDEEKKDFDMDEYNEYILAYDNETRLKKYKVLNKVSMETMRFMRGKYALDEVGNGDDELAFFDGDKTVLTIYIRDGYYIFQIGENSVRVFDTESLEKAEKMILSFMKPNRVPFSKERAVYSDCGHRCDLCQHYDGGTVSDKFRLELIERVNRVYGSDNTAEDTMKTIPLCNGCGKAGFGQNCPQRECAAGKGAAKCTACPEYDCGKATAGYQKGIEAKSISADDVTLAILPYVAWQYGN